MNITSTLKPHNTRPHRRVTIPQGTHAPTVSARDLRAGERVTVNTLAATVRDPMDDLGVMVLHYDGAVPWATVTRGDLQGKRVALA